MLLLLMLLLMLLLLLHHVLLSGFLGSPVNRVPDQECSTPTARTNLRADLCFCNGHLTAGES